MLIPIKQYKRQIIIGVVLLIIIVGAVVYYRKKFKGSINEVMNYVRPYVWESLIKSNKEDFIKSVEAISKYLGLNSPNDLLMVMKKESGLNPQAQNTAFPFAGGYATGLIQFIPSTAIYLGTTVAALYAMSNLQQLDYVKKYFSPYRGKVKSYTDLYMVTFFPAALGKPDNYVIQSDKVSAAKIAASNPGVDLNKDNQITVGEFKQAVMKGVPVGYGIS